MAVTQSQKLAIESDGCNILVSASAGAGKTFVMMERIKRLILEKNVDIDKILCVTFTTLAAKEMKEKLADKITDSLKTCKEGKRAKLEYQLELLPTASISTMHAFCKNLLSEYFYEVGLDPSFNVMDEKDSKLLVNRVIDRLFEELYDKKDGDLELLLPYLYKKRKDKAVKEKVIAVYNAFISEADPKSILEKGEFFYTDKGIEFIAEQFIKEIYAVANNLLLEGKALVEELSSYEKISAFAEHLTGAVEVLINCYRKEYLVLSYEETCAIAENIVLKNRPRKSKNEDPFEDEALEKVGRFKQKVKLLFDNIKEKYAVRSLAEEKNRAKEILPVYNALKNITLAFSDAYAKEKRNENLVDFSDLEHLTLNLLKNEEIRKEIAERYEYIFTDEYQDTSGVQEAILALIARDNLFMVGDVKQSIYDFRGCNPDIFANKYNDYQKGNGGIAINLDKNFRSSKKVLTAVNRLFSDIMTEECGRVDYRKNPMEVGASYPEEEGETVMFSITKSKGETVLPEGVYSVVGHLNVLTQNKCFAEGRAVANLIETLVGKSYYDVKTNSYKSIDYSSIAILLRDANKDADKFAVEFSRLGIPFCAPSKDSIANYPEVAKIIDLLKLIDCFNQDVPLASVLKSEVGKVTDRELLKIREFTPEGSFVDAVNLYIKNKDDEISNKLKEFENYYNSLRVLSEFTPCGELIAKVVSEKGIDVKILSSRLGEVKLARVNKFIEVANSSKQTVSEFLLGLDGLLEKLTMSSVNTNAVQIMSIHASKGLEFPVVILGRVSKKFSIESVKGDFLTDRYAGVSINYRDTNKMIVTESLFNKYLKFVKTKRMREEEMRLLYVAMTRAQSRLYVINEYSNEDGATPKDMHDVDVYNATSYFKMFALKDFEVRGEEDIFKTSRESEIKQVIVGEADEDLVKTIRKNLAFEYPYKNRSTLSVKRSVTQAAHFEESDQTPVEKAPIVNENSTEIGNAYHKLLELCDFTLSPEDAVNGAIGSLLMPDEYKNLIDKEKAVKILYMPVFNLIKDYTLYKEQPFTCFMPGGEVEENYVGEEEVLIQGIIDLLAIKDGKAIIVDYKHSLVFKDEVLIARYKKQLQLYAYAVKKVLKIEVERCYLVNVNHCKSVEVAV